MTMRNSVLMLGGVLLTTGLWACSGSPIGPTRTLLTPAASGLIAGASTGAVVGASSGHFTVRYAGQADGDNQVEPTEPGEKVEPTEPTEKVEPTEPTEKVEPTEPTDPDGDRNQERTNEGNGQNSSSGTSSVKVTKH